MQVSKASCPGGRVTPGSTLKYTVNYSNQSDATTGATSAVLVDTIPVTTTVTDAGGGNVSQDGATVTWNLGNLAIGEGGTKTFTVFVPGSLNNTDLINNVELSAANGVTVSAQAITPVSNEGASASGRAFGVRADLLGGGILASDPDIGPRPDTNTSNPGQEEGVTVPGIIDVGLLKVVKSDSVSNTDANASAIATTSDVAINLPGVSVTAKSVVARSVSHANGFTADSSRAGSKVQDLVINGVKHQDVTDSKTFDVNDPITGKLLARVSVLETIADGAAGSAVQPQSGFFRSGLTVQGIHVQVFDTTTLGQVVTSDVIVAHANSTVNFPSGLACGAAIARVSGDAFVMATKAPSPPAALSIIGLVNLPITGGLVETSVSSLSFGSGSGTSRTEGTLVPLRAFSFAETERLDIGATATATSIRAEVDTATLPGKTTIKDLKILGTDVCLALGATGTCTPPPDTVLVLDTAGGPAIVVLNEQAGLGGRVNAVHIYFIGSGSSGTGFAETIISSAFASTS
ncbi:MAG: choice-of-anchor P family protein [Actinomycetota bacterium]